MISGYNINNIIEQTEQLMNEFGIPLRDTWAGITGYNYDDYYSNGNVCNGKRHFGIIQKEDGFADTKIGRGYNIDGFNSTAYDNYKIRIPQRLLSFMHPIIHETVHFLQANTLEEDSKYVNYNGQNLTEYIAQRTELEAHFVQIKYIERFEIDKAALENNFKNDFLKVIKGINKFNPNVIGVVMYAKALKII
jgi:hypothetical protein